MSTRLFVSAELFNGAEVYLTGDRARYLGKVLRARTGDSITLFNGDGLEWSASISQVTRNQVDLSVAGCHDPGTESALNSHLVQGVSRGERMDFVVQKATELGVKRITPVLTEYGVVKLSGDRADKRREHWQKIATGACEQCGRTQLPLIDAPVRLNDWFGQTANIGDTRIVLAPGATATLRSLTAPSKEICVLIGPEGGFSDVELENANIAGFHAVSVGPRILRTESAAVAVLAVMQSMWGDLG